MTAGLRARRERRAAAHALYVALVDQAREPLLFTDLAVPDTREGRLEMVMLHAILVLRRLQAEGPTGRLLGQELFDIFFADLDRHMREWGVGDLSVGKHVKRVAQTFYARAAAVEPALATGEADALLPVLTRNVYGAAAVETRQVQGLARYLLDQAEWLGTRPAGDLLEGRIAFRPATCAA